MDYRSFLKPNSTNALLPLKILLFIIALFSLFSFWLDPYLALSLKGIERGFVWQFATYALIHPLPRALLQLGFNLYLIWTFGSSLIQRIHLIPFFILYFGSAIVSGLFAISGMALTHTLAPLAGSGPVLFSLLISWTLLNPDAQLLLFFTLPFKARHLVLGLIGATLLLEISHAQWISFLADLGGILFGYLFTLITCPAHSPFSCLRFFENSIFRGIEKLHSLKKKRWTHTKIYDIKSGSPLLNDEEFMDAMLAKISLYGEGFLTSEEQKRMHQISEKKNSKKK